MKSSDRPRIVIFTGPSMPVHDAEKILEAVYLPPARQADMLSAIHKYDPDIIGLIDGEFSQALSVWHKEILFAIERGIHVYGAASMGALRAAEIAPYGMHGVGDIFEMYRSGAIEDDDEVALQHASADEDYRNLSLPMVNIRATLHRALNEDRVSVKDHDAFIRVAKSLFFRSRQTQQMCEEALDSGMNMQAVAQIRNSLENRYVDLKRHDARQLLELLRNIENLSRDTPKEWQLNSSPYFQQMQAQDRVVQSTEFDVTFSQIGHYHALNEAKFDEHNFNARNRILVILLAEILRAEPDSNDIDEEIARFKKKRSLESGDAFNEWIKDNDMDACTFGDLIKEIATCRMLHHWLNSRDPNPDRVTPVLNELRLCGLYPEIAEKTANHADLSKFDCPDDSDEPSTQGFSNLVAEQLEHSNWELNTSCEKWVSEAGFAHLSELRTELIRNRRARQKTVNIAKQLARDLY